MKITKRISLFILTFCLINTAYAQNQMKNPVRFKLKNGLTVIVAQNTGMGKIYSRLTVENEVSDAQKTIAQALETYLNYKAEQFNAKQSADNKVTSKINITYNEANTSTNIFNFEQALSYVATTLLDPAFSATAFEEMKASYTGNKTDLKAIKLTDLQSFYADHFKTADIFITIAGDITPADAKLIANRTFGTWNAETTLISE